MNEGKVAFFGDSKTAIDYYYGLTQSDRMLRATKSTMPSGESIEHDTVGHSSSGIVLKPVKSMYPDGDAAARFLGFAVMDQTVKHTGFFRQGDGLTTIYDIEVRAEIEI